MKTLRAKTKKKWTSKYGDKVPFDFTAKDVKTCKARDDYTEESSLGYNIAGAAHRQRSFFYQVSLPHYRDRVFLAASLDRYRKYLYLKKLHIQEFLVPCYDMDLMWHTHQVHPIEYAKDTNMLLGMILPHDDSVNDRSEGSKLNNSYAMTVQFWKDAFGGEAFQKSGAMFRGSPPGGMLADIPSKMDKELLDKKEVNLVLEKLEIPGFSWNEPTKATVEIRLESYSHGQPTLSKSLIKMPWTVGDGKGFTSSKLQLQFKLSSRFANFLEVNVNGSRKRGILCCAKEVEMARLQDRGMPITASSLTKVTNCQHFPQLILS